jgi:chorismate lyase/3-hydroxybenzoate synthase
MNAQPRLLTPLPALSPSYVQSRDPRSLLGPHTLAVFGFGSSAQETLDDPRYLRVPLEPLDADALPVFEVWTCAEPVELWQDGALRGARSGRLSFGHLQLCEPPEAGIGGPAVAAESAYRRLAAHAARSPFPHLLRVWNYLDAIVEGEDDSERYRQFCIGRAEALHIAEGALPAATAIGHRRGDRSLLVYWLSADQPGRPIENPRQLPAYRYPRSYGPRAPSFARAMLADTQLPLPLMLSGTAAVVGHASLHADSFSAQLRETFRNFDSLLGAARQLAPALGETFSERALLKVYLRDRESLPEARTLLAELLPSTVPHLILHGDICRRELAVEIDGFHA